MTSVFISILNWNDAARTLHCVHAVHKSAVSRNVTVTLVVLDNGSNPADWAVLQQGLANTAITLIRQEANTGFAAGHNVVIRQAIERQADYIWLLNNDAIVKPDTLAGLLQAISESPECGVVSPLIYAHYDEGIVDFIGAVQDWKKLETRNAGNPAEAKEMQASHPSDFVVWGTAPLFKATALKATGLLAESLFAYCEDGELCARLSKAGWSSRMAFSVSIQHFRRKAVFDERPPYWFYLMTRNSLLVYLLHTPPEFRRRIRLRLLSRAMISAANLREHGQPEKSNACLLGIWDGLLGRDGPPRLNVTPPAFLGWISSVFPYRLQQWLDAD
ncbi:glycosyltransferase [Rhodoferax ferrireducens]|uniref:glycosyltransferase n=1 Tax=Rhodoferax ferrireducens TaxID=192843 RepID=UPI000E0D306F|nr:glycosyltransferase family 2 protein [Rhodoferax ferrireducens]